MTRKILKSTPRGQITLPKRWRDHFPTDNYLVEMHANKLVIIPFHLEHAPTEDTVFDADRDNNGKGISPDEMIVILKKIRHG